jgi:transposase-like protein
MGTIPQTRCPLQKRQRFSAEFKREAVLLQESGKQVAVLARELGVPRNRAWKRAQGAHPPHDTVPKQDLAAFKTQWAWEIKVPNVR